MAAASAYPLLLGDDLDPARALPSSASAHLAECSGCRYWSALAGRAPPEDDVRAASVAAAAVAVCSVFLPTRELTGDGRALDVVHDRLLVVEVDEAARASR